MTLDPSNKADVQATTYPPHSTMKLHYAWDLCLHDYIMPEIALCPKNRIIACAWDWLMLEELHHRMCSILHVPEEMHHCMCPILHTSEETHHCMCPKKCIIALCPRLHCARSLYKPKIASCPNQIKSQVSIDSKNRYALFTHYLYSKGVILQRHHPSWPANFMSLPEDFLCLPCP